MNEYAGAIVYSGREGKRRKRRLSIEKGIQQAFLKGLFQIKALTLKVTNQLSKRPIFISMAILLILGSFRLFPPLK